MRRRSLFAIGPVLVAVLMTGCGGGSRAVPGSSAPAQPSAVTTTAAPGLAATAGAALAPSTRAQISTQISAANLTAMQAALSSFLAEQDIR